MEAKTANRRTEAPRTERLILSVTPETKAAVAERARAAGMTMSTLVNTILLAYLQDDRVLPEL